MSSNNSDSFSEKVRETKNQALAELERAISLDTLESWRINYLGRRDSQMNQIMRMLAKLSPEERRDSGALANDLKSLLEIRFSEAQKTHQRKSLDSLSQANHLDVTLPGRPFDLGRLHPITQTMREICDAFSAMGFQIVDGPEIEWDHYNFEQLNIPSGHPARDQFDTLWVDYTDNLGNHPMLLRTHTSPVQIRVMEKNQPPIRVVVPGKVYRYEATDATHEWHFQQVEGLVVDEGIAFPHLKGTLSEFARRLFGSERRVRLRCDYFPFVEPGVDISIDCFNCAGSGSATSTAEPCRICQQTGWLEIMGAGMVHPRVLQNVGYDSSRYTGFAFGIGVERVAMLKHGIDDVRLFYSNDLRFLRQF
jgi:phenylalanyl-tRNA synthetase alpha chain